MTTTAKTISYRASVRTIIENGAVVDTDIPCSGMDDAATMAHAKRVKAEHGSSYCTVTIRTIETTPPGPFFGEARELFVGRPKIVRL